MWISLARSFCFLAVASLAFASAVHALSLSDLTQDQRRALLVRAEFLADGTTQLVSVAFSNGPPRGVLGNPEDQIRIEYFDGDGDRLGFDAAWDPRWGHNEGDDPEIHDEDFLDAATGTFQIPLTSVLDEVRLYDASGGTAQLELVVDVASAVTTYCTTHAATPPCTPPTSDAGGQYYLLQGSGLTLDGSASVDAQGGGLTFEWDLDGDGVFGEDVMGSSNGGEQGVAPTFSAPGASVGSVIDVVLRVCDAESTCDADSTTVTVVPEPGFAMSLLLGSAALVGAQRRRSAIPR